MATPKLKVIIDGKYVASCEYPEDALMIVSGNGRGSISYDRRVTLWQEGSEEIPAGESYDQAAEIMLNRLADFKDKMNRLRLKNLGLSE